MPDLIKKIREEFDMKRIYRIRIWNDSQDIWYSKAKFAATAKE